MNPSNTYGIPVIAGGKTATYTGAAATTAAMPANCESIRVVSTTDCFIEIGIGVTATTAGTYLPAFQPEYFACPPSGVVSAIQVAAAGTLYVNPIA